MTTRVANLAQNLLLRSVITRTQNRLFDSQLQISTQQKSQNYAGIAEDSNRIVTLENARDKIDNFVRNNTFITLRIQTMLASIDAVKNTIKEARGLLNEILDDGTLPSGIDKDAMSEIQLSQMEDFLNTRINGRYLFAGSKTATKPVQLGDITVAPNDSGTPNYTTNPESSFYYQGDDTTLSARIDEGVVVNYGTTAANTGFEKAIRAIRILRTTTVDNSTASQTRFQNAKDLIDQATAALSELELKLGTNLNQVTDANKQHEELGNFFGGIVGDLESANTFEAVARLNQDQTMLEASYKTAVRLSSLSLTNFI